MPLDMTAHERLAFTLLCLLAEKLDDRVIWTGADWLFAYWIARTANEFKPLVGAGANPREHHIDAPRPAWTR